MSYEEIDGIVYIILSYKRCFIGFLNRAKPPAIVSSLLFSGYFLRKKSETDDSSFTDRRGGITGRIAAGGM
jgi:hypothetical protein